MDEGQLHALTEVSTCTHTHVFHMYMSCLGSSAGRALCLECRVSWVRVPPETAHFSQEK